MIYDSKNWEWGCCFGKLYGLNVNVCVCILILYTYISFVVNINEKLINITLT